VCQRGVWIVEVMMKEKIMMIVVVVVLWKMDLRMECKDCYYYCCYYILIYLEGFY
jgi:hypothetical protein